MSFSRDGLTDLRDGGGDEAEVVRKDREITTQQAAELLGISRPSSSS